MRAPTPITRALPKHFPNTSPHNITTSALGFQPRSRVAAQTFRPQQMRRNIILQNRQRLCFCACYCKTESNGHEKPSLTVQGSHPLVTAQRETSTHRDNPTGPYIWVLPALGTCTSSSEAALSGVRFPFLPMPLRTVRVQN